MNEQIQSPEVRLIDEHGEQVGVISLEQALQMAQDRDLDLVEVGPDAQPPACRLLDFDKLRYIRKKKREKSRKNVKRQEIKEIRLSPTTSDNDILTKVNQARKFIQGGDKVKVVVQFKGREISHPELGKQVVEQVHSQLLDITEEDSPLAMERYKLTLILKPI